MILMFHQDGKPTYLKEALPAASAAVPWVGERSTLSLVQETIGQIVERQSPPPQVTPPNGTRQETLFV